MRAGTACFRLSVLFHPCQEGSRRQLSTLTLLLERRLSVGQREYMGPKLEACQLLLSFASAVEIASGVLRGFGSVCSCILSSTLAWKACCRSICSYCCVILARNGMPGSLRLTLHIGQYERGRKRSRDVWTWSLSTGDLSQQQQYNSHLDRRRCLAVSSSS